MRDTIDTNKDEKKQRKREIYRELNAVSIGCSYIGIQAEIFCYENFIQTYYNTSFKGISWEKTKLQWIF